MKLVKFKSGKYGIRKLTVWGYKYKDIKGNYWWSRDSKFYINCQGERGEVRKKLESLTDQGRPV